MSKSVYFTTPIYYVNASPHMGHSYTTILGDIAWRYHRLLGYETYYLTGTDEHGDKIMRAATKNNETPQEWVDRTSQQFRDLWPQLNINTDDFIRTTEERHKVVVRQVLQDLYDKDEVYSAAYGGYYCTGCERYYTEKEMAKGNQCPDHLTELEWIEETNYYFRMSKYQDWLLEHIEANPDYIRPEKFKNKIVSFLKEDKLKDLSISRPIDRVPWGIPLPFDEEHVTYVWFDALLNYCSALGFPDGEKFKKFWPTVQHFVAKDILIPHAVYWPTMMKAAGIEPYQHLNVHGYWQINEHKMSKSSGEVVNPLSLSEKYGVDAFRYYLTREMRLGNDSDFSEVALVDRINSELGNDLGNMVKRVTTMISKYFDGVIPEASVPAPNQELLDGIEKDILESLEKNVVALDLFSAAETTIFGAKQMNKYITDEAPWTLAKNGETDKLAALLNRSARLLGLVGQALCPIMPVKGPELLACFGVKEIPSTINPDLVTAGLKVNKDVVLFQRVEAPEIEEVVEEVKPKIEFKPEIEFEDFAKLDLRVAKIEKAERVPKTDKLVHLELDDGSGVKREIVAGIAEHYSVDQLIGRQVIVIANLKPRKMRGKLSQGMLLAAKDGSGLHLLAPSGEVETGTAVS